jgi:type II secretory pathway component PulK
MNRRGSVFILALWMIAFFGMMVAALGARVRTQAGAAGRFADRALSRPVVFSGATYIAAFLRSEPEEKALREPDRFREVALPDGSAFSIQRPADGTFGLGDEGDRVDLNAAPPAALTALLARAAELGQDRASALAKAVVEWRGRKEDFLEPGYRLPEGGAGIGSVEELLAVPGMTPEAWQALRPHVTVHAPAGVNLNTVLVATMEFLGLDAALARRIAEYREGHAKAAAEGPPFRDLGDLTQKIGVSPEEDLQLQNLGPLWTFETASYRFRVRPLRTRGGRPCRAPGGEFVMDQKGRILAFKEL